MVYERVTDKVRVIDEKEIISDSSPIRDVVLYLSSTSGLDHYFVKRVNNFIGIVTRADLNKMPVRVWLFGKISLFEDIIKSFLHNSCVDIKDKISSNRYKKAQRLFSYKQQQNEETTLIHCLQICDLYPILKGYDLFDAFFDIEQKSEYEAYFNDLTNLRNNLAHGSPIKKSWRKIGELIRFLESMKMMGNAN
jgi:hypothetical protein